jgi:ArsR family metal-binding transcriptional regulator
MFPSAAHSRYRGMAIEKRMENIMSLYNSGLKPIQILAQLQSENNPDLEGLTRHDIYNAIRKHRQQEELEGLTGKP